MYTILKNCTGLLIWNNVEQEILVKSTEKSKSYEV